MKTLVLLPVQHCASAISRPIHPITGAIAQLECLYDIVNLLPSCQGKHQLWVIKTLRGLASTTRLRSDLIKLDAAKILLQNIFEGKDSANQLEIVHAVMNLSVSVKERTLVWRHKFAEYR